MWVPGHMGIRRNENADRAAKEALEKETLDDLMPFSDLKPLTAKYIHQVWQKEWDEAIVVSKTHKRFKERFLIGRNRTKCANFQVELIVCFSVIIVVGSFKKRTVPKICTFCPVSSN